MYEINFEIPAFLLSLLCYIYCLTAKHRQYILPKGFKNKLANQHFVFLLMLVTNILSAISSVVGVYLTEATFTGVAFWQYLFHAFYFVFHATLSVSFTLYIINVTSTSINWKKIYYILFAIPYVISEIIVLTNSFTGWAFYMDYNLIYHRGPLMILLYAIGGLYVALGFFFFFKNKKAISKVDSIAVAFFIGIATLGIIIQAVKSSFLVELFSESLACLVIMIVLEEKSGHIDLTTGLLNRIAFTDDNRRLINTKQKYGLVLLKIKELDKITNRFGGREIDALLINIASYLVKESGVVEVYCYRRDGYAVLYKELNYDKATEFMNKALERFNNEWKIGSLELKADIITTLVKVPEDIKSIEELENLISSGYTKAKTGSYYVSIEEVKEITNSGKYEEALRRAITEKKLMLKYQPIWSTSEAKTVSAEALLRVDSDELRNISPEVYIPIAEKSGLIKDIGLFVFEEVCKFLCDERIKNSSIKYVELNLSVYQFMYNDLIDSFEEIRKRYNVDASKINLEITETAATLDEDVISNTLKEFQKLGYTLSLDDFGTGYSNLMRMTESNYQNIKIDKSILWKVCKEEKGDEMLKDLMSFVRTLNAEIIQEGVETKEQLDKVISCGCDYIQGFYFSAPIKDEDFIKYINNEQNN